MIGGIFFQVRDDRAGQSGKSGVRILLQRRKNRPQQRFGFARSLPLCKRFLPGGKRNDRPAQIFDFVGHDVENVLEHQRIIARAKILHALHGGGFFVFGEARPGVGYRRFRMCGKSLRTESAARLPCGNPCGSSCRNGLRTACRVHAVSRSCAAFQHGKTATKQFHFLFQVGIFLVQHRNLPCPHGIHTPGAAGFFFHFMKAGANFFFAHAAVSTSARNAEFFAESGHFV